MKISDRVKLPLKICQGTVKQRHALAEKMLENFVSLVEPKMQQNGALPLKSVKPLIKKALPYRNISFEVIKSPDENSHFMVHADESNFVDSLCIVLRTDKKGNITEEEKNDLYHEAWHFYENLTKPKLYARFSNVEDYKLEKFETFYHQNFYTTKKYKPKFLIKKLDKFLSKFNDTDKIHFLQFLREDLEAEHYAYTLAEKYAPMLSPCHEMFRFPKKLAVAENYLRNLLQNIRAKKQKK